VAVTDDREQLPCGTQLEQLIVQIADREPPIDPRHQADCPYCQATLRRLRTGWADLRRLNAEPVPIPADLTVRIMARARALARQTAGALVLGTPRGETRIAHTVVTRSIQRIALAVPGVVFASVRAIAPDPPDPARLSVSIRLVIAFGPSVGATTHALRTLIDRRIPRLTGGRIARIDILVDDIADAP
jgi:hypothetical protein